MSNYDKVCQDNLQTYFYLKNAFKTLKGVHILQVSNEFINLEDQIASINSLSSPIFFFKWPLVDAVNEVKAYTLNQLNKVPERNAERHFRNPFSEHIIHYPSPKPC